MPDNDYNYRCAVIYTDGSARTVSPTLAGFGLHGYTYLNKSDKQHEYMGCIITNQGYIAKDKIKHMPPGVTLVEPIEVIETVMSIEAGATSNTAELEAVLHAVKTIKNQIIDSNYVYSELLIVTDSEYVKKGLIDFCPGWASKDWKKSDGSPIACESTWRELYRLYCDFPTLYNCKIDLRWVKTSHSYNNTGNDPGNMRADSLATVASIYSSKEPQTQTKIQRSFVFEKYKKYTKPEIERHPFLTHPRMFFNSEMQYNREGYYYTAEPGVDDLLFGKRNPGASLAVLRMHAGDPAIDAVVKKQTERAGDQNAVIMLKLDRVFSKEVWPMLKEHETNCLRGNRKNLNIDFIDKKPVTLERNPTSLSIRALDYFNSLDGILDRFQKIRASKKIAPDGGDEFTIHCMTEYFFDRIVKKDRESLSLKKEFGNGFKNTAFEVGIAFFDKIIKVKIPCILGLDILTRNSLKKMEDKNTEIYVVTWKTDTQVMRHATIITCIDGIGIWSNFFSDRIFILDSLIE